MMPKPPHLCMCGFLSLAYGELCPCQRKQKQERNARHDRRRPSSSARGYTSTWERARLAFLIENETCRCGEAATVVDHIIPHRGDKALFWNRANWQALCTRCHNSWKQRFEFNYRKETTTEKLHP